MYPARRIAHPVLRLFCFLLYTTVIVGSIYLVVGYLWIGSFFGGMSAGWYGFLLSYADKGALFAEETLFAASVMLALVYRWYRQQPTIRHAVAGMAALAGSVIALLFFGTTSLEFGLVRRTTQQQFALHNDAYYLTVESSMDLEPRYYLFQCDRSELICKRVWYGSRYTGSGYYEPIINIDPLEQTLRVTQGTRIVYQQP